VCKACSRNAGSSTTPFLPSRPLADFELRLDQQHSMGAGSCQPGDNRDDISQGDERDISDDHVRCEWQIVRHDLADVDAAHLDDARISGDARVELTVAHIEGDDLVSAPAQQHIAEAARRRADIEAAQALRRWQTD
jgi:hypothetical protein